MRVRICVKKYGFAELEVENESDVYDLVSDMDDRDFDWSDIDPNAEIVEKIE